MDLAAILNPEQLAAVKHTAGPLLVFAGAGSGKTRVITHRIAHLIEAKYVRPWRILAVTFTNKAAGEMRERLEKLIGEVALEVWVMTFHAFGAKFLRLESQAAGLTRSFSIYDDDDQLSIMKKVAKEAGLDEKQHTPRGLLQKIDRLKNLAIEPDGFQPAQFDFQDRAVAKVYPKYQQALAAADAVDFGDLLVQPLHVLRKHPEVRERWGKRFEHVMVDEFQDTNPAQYSLLRMLVGPEKNLCVVGDDDQSIYRWRGAEVANILSFAGDHPGTQVVKLEQNYRSTANILGAAQAVIEKNARRADKKLWTKSPGGEQLRLLAAWDERDEAERIADAVAALHKEGTHYASMSIFYRTNAQSRPLEESLRVRRIPYQIVRGRSFYERAEIKDAVGYLRLCANPRSDADLRRVINTPTRGIGDVTVERLEAARRQGESLWDMLGRFEDVPDLNAGARKSVGAFRTLMQKLMALNAGAVGDLAEAVIQESGLLQKLADEGTPESEERQDNLWQLVAAAREFDRAFVAPAPEDIDLPATALLGFLEQLALLGDQDDLVEGMDRIPLMTLHAAKGLEFDAVFMSGLEERVFPHQRAIGGGFYDAIPDPEEMAEERRLCYVGMTRAKKLLSLSFARRRTLFGREQANPPSRFLTDLPEALVLGGLKAVAAVMAEREAVHQRFTGERVEYDAPYRRRGDDEYDQRPAYERGLAPTGRPRNAPRPTHSVPVPVRARVATVTAGGLQPGSRVRHKIFGVGEVQGVEGDGPDAKLTVRFPGVGLKRILARFVEAG